MRITHLKIDGFKNLNIDIDITPTVNIIVGENANGKTNIIEAVWLATGCRSFRNLKDKDIVDFDKDRATVEITYKTRERENKILYVVEKSNPKDKKVYLNGVKKKTLSMLFGNLRCIIFTPDDLELSKGGPEHRRNFIDICVSQLKPVYIMHLKKYNDVLSQRNTLLKEIQMGRGDVSLLDIYDEQLIEHGTNISLMRDEYSHLLRECTKRVFFDMSRGHEYMSLKYQSTVFEDLKNAKIDDLKEIYKEKLLSMRDEDIRLGFTGIGTHRDDIIIEVNDLNLREYGSQGQQRSVALSLKLAQAEILMRLTGESPIILFDDALSEIDKRRQSYVMNEIDDMQVILTCCDPIVALDARIGNLYAIQRGEVIDFIDNLKKMRVKPYGCVIDNIDVSKVTKLDEKK